AVGQTRNRLRQRPGLPTQAEAIAPGGGSVAAVGRTVKKRDLRRVVSGGQELSVHHRACSGAAGRGEMSEGRQRENDIGLKTIGCATDRVDTSRISCWLGKSEAREELISSAGYISDVNGGLIKAGIGRRPTDSPRGQIDPLKSLQRNG